MRATAERDGVHVKAYAGSTGVLVAMDVDDELREGLLGFAISRRVGRGASTWLNGMLSFEGTAHSPGEPVATNLAPIQKFRWSDYTVYPDTSYRYEIHPVYGEAGRLEIGDGPEVSVRTSGRRTGDHIVIFNRAAAASQAFSRRFPFAEAILDKARLEGDAHPQLPDDVLEWLSRGVLEQIVGIADAALDEGWALDVAIYEYELPAIADAVERAHARGAHVRVVYHSKSGDPQTDENERMLAGLPEDSKTARTTSSIFHDKFIVLSKIGSRGQRLPQAVLCGSTNFTENGVYRQANVVHVVRRRDVAASYLELFETLARGDTTSQTRSWISENNPIDPEAEVFAGFSPRSDGSDLAAFRAAIDVAERDVLFCTAFDLHDTIEESLLGLPGDPVVRFGMQNTRSAITGFHRDRNARFGAAAFLSRGLEGFLKESTAGQRGNILIHTKLIVIDFTSDAPVVISGSHNLSGAASKSNDENYLIVRGDVDVADCYGVELMRLYDHYRFRWVQKEFPSPPKLTLTDEWTDRYFEAGLYQSDRLRFAGR